MAKIIFSNGAEIRGTIGGTTYSRNASGAYIRNYVKPVNANTVKQQAVRNQFSTISSAYRSLSLRQRQTYKDMSQFYPKVDSVGNTVFSTPSQLFARLNGTLLQNNIIGLADIMLTCPVPVDLTNPAVLHSDYTVATSDLFANTLFANNETIVPDDCILVVSATPAISAGIKSVPKNTYSRISSILVVH